MSNFVEILTIGGNKNTLGEAKEVLQIVLNDQSCLNELFDCISNDDAWVRMRAIDTFEKIGRLHPDWLEPYVERLLGDIAKINQASIQWHLAEIFCEVQLTDKQRSEAIEHLKSNIGTNEADWIVSANTMKALAKFAGDGYVSPEEITPLLKLQQTHRSPAVVKRATKLLGELN